MSKILRRPMFRGGGSIDSRGTGITSGLDRPDTLLMNQVVLKYILEPNQQVPQIQDPKIIGRRLSKNSSDRC